MGVGGSLNTYKTVRYTSYVCQMHVRCMSDACLMQIRHRVDGGPHVATAAIRVRVRVSVRVRPHEATARRL